MKNHLPWIGALLGVGVLLAGLHFVVFAPLKAQYDEVQGELGRSVASLKDEVNSIRWKDGRTPDPRKPDFSWRGLLDEVQGTYVSKLDTYKDIVRKIDVSYVAPTEQEKTKIILERIATLQEMERETRGKLSVLEKWGLETWNNTGYGGTRCLDLRWGGYRTYAGEERITGPQGTIQLAFNYANWKTTPEALAKRDQQTAQMEDTRTHVIFHAGRQKPKDPNLPEGVPPGYSSEIAIERVGLNLIARVVGPAGQVFTKQVNMYDWLAGEDTAESTWKVLKITWGPNPNDTNFYIDGKPADQVNAAMMARTGGPANIGGGAGMYNPYGGGGGAGMYNPYGGGGGAGMYNPYGGGFDGGGMSALSGGINRAGQMMQDPGYSLETLDGFGLGCDLETKNRAAIQIDSVRIWNQVSGPGDPLVAPLFQEDFETPFGTDEELRRGMDQAIRYHSNLFDPQNSQEVRDKFYFWYLLQLGAWAIYADDKGPYVRGMWLLSWMDHVSKKLPATFGDPDRLTSILTLPDVITDEVRQSLLVFLGLTIEVAQGLIDANVEKVEGIHFLNWSHTLNDEGLKASFKEAFGTLQDQVKMGSGPMMGMGMMGMGMYGMPGYGGMAGYGGMPGYGDPYGREESYSASDDPEKIKAAKEAAEKAREEANKAMQEAIEAQTKLKERQEKLAAWTPYFNTNQIPPDYYAEYRSQAAGEGQEFFLRYSMRTDFRTDREHLAGALYNLEFGSKLAFLSSLSLVPDAVVPTRVNVQAHLEFNYMNDTALGVASDREGPAEGEGQDTAPGGPLQSSQAPPPAAIPVAPGRG